MAWDDKAPTKEELKGAGSGWDSEPPTKDELDPNKMKGQALLDFMRSGKDQSARGQANPNNTPDTLMQTAVEHGANAASLGYLPQLQAAAEKPVYGALNALTGQDVNPDSYVDARDKNVSRLAQEEKDNPKTAMGADLGGSVVGALATPLPEIGLLKGGGMLAKTAKPVVEGAAYGAGYGALQNPGDKPGVVDPAQLSQRTENAKSGAKMGATTGAVTGVVSKGLNKLSTLGDSAEKTAQEQAVKSSGAMLKDFRQLNGKDQTSELGQWLMDKGIVQAGDTTRTVAEKSEAALQDAGKRLDSVYKGAVGKAQGLSPEEMAKFGFNPVRDKDQILKAVREKLGDAPNAKTSVNEISNYLDDLAVKYGDKGMPPKEANNIKGLMDKQVNYSRNPLNPSPNSETAYSAARNELSKIIDQHIDLVGKINDDPKLLEALKAANKDYGFAKQASNMANDKIAREEANRAMSLTDTIAAGAGGAAGGVLFGGGDVNHGAEGAVGGAAAAGILNHAARKFGPGIAAGTLNAAKTPLKALKPLGAASKGLMSQAAQRGLISTGMLNDRQD